MLLSEQQVAVQASIGAGGTTFSDFRDLTGTNGNYGGVALMWRGGCIIRSVFLGRIKEAFDDDPNLENLLLVGNDGIVPHRRVPDETGLANEYDRSSAGSKESKYPGT